MLEGQKVLITGANGRVAFPIARALAQSNEVWGVARFTDPGSQSSAEGAMVSLQISASDPHPYPLRYAAINLPAGLDIGPSTGLIGGTLEDPEAARAPTTVTVTVDDGNGGTAQQTFQWWVAATPIDL